MAEYSVVFAMKRIGDLLIEEAIFLHGVSNKVAEIQTELKRMQCFLRDADARQDEDEMIRNWVAEIREVAFDAEDAIETFAFRASLRRRGRLWISFKRLACIFSHGRELHRIDSQIDAIKGRLSSLTASLQTYNIRAIGGGESSGPRNERQRLLRRSYSHVVDEDTVGVEESVKILVEQLVKPGKKCLVVSIWGMGGLGKTTLAKKVYHHGDVRRHFDCFAWICISQRFNTRGVVQGILMKLATDSEKERQTFETMSDDGVLKKVYEMLEKKRCLVILDDLWEIDHWESLRPAFPLHERRRGSKLVLTTRNQAVALHVDPHGLIYQPKYLTEEESWELLQRKAFPSHDDNGRDATINENMEELGKEMVKYCGGLPLAVIVLGGLLATKNTLYEWELVYGNIKSYLRNKGSTQQGKGVSDVLALSYQDLPYHLKPCFLYLAHFPEDHEIPTNTLIQMWEAEGMISNMTYEGMGEETLEDVAEGYLGEIIGRCMVQVTRRSSNGQVKNCRLHDLMRDLCLSKAKEENFLEIINFTVSSTMVAITTSNKVRRRVIYVDQGTRNFSSTAIQANYATHLRSLVVFCCTTGGLCWTWGKLDIKDLKFLRVLNLGGLLLGKKILRAIGNLVHLKFLSIKNAWLLCFPSSIRNLGCIQTLDLRFYTHHQITCSRIHNVICGKKWLRHLYLPDYTNEGNAKVPWDNFSNLETLINFDAGKWDVKDLAQLAKLRKLKIFNLKSVKELEVIVKPQCPISNSLQSLVLGIVSTKMGEIDVLQLSTCQHLFKLRLSGEISNLPKHHHFPPNLSKLTLSCSRLKQDPMPILEKLLNLTILHLLHDVYLGKEMIFSTNGFPRLEHLILCYFSYLKSLRLDEGAMPSLKRLKITDCLSLKMVPKGLRYVTTLQVLEISYMYREFEERIQEVNGKEGEDFYEVQHVPSILFHDNIFEVAATTEEKLVHGFHPRGA